MPPLPARHWYSPQLLNSFTEDLSLNFFGKTLHPVISAKDLGVIIDAHLRFDEHISKSVSSCTMSILCLINRIRHLLDQKTLSIIRCQHCLKQIILLFIGVGRHCSKEHKEATIGPRFCRTDYNKYLQIWPYNSSLKRTKMVTGGSKPIKLFKLGLKKHLLNTWISLKFWTFVSLAKKSF